MKTGLSTRTGISFSKSPGIKLNFDAQTGGFTSGNTITGATSGATAVVLEEIGGETLTLTGISGTFQDDEIIYESALGSELVTNGGFDSDTTRWTASGATLASVAGGEAGNCMEITTTGDAQGFGYQDIGIGVTEGNTYKAVIYFKKGTGTTGRIKVQDTSGVTTYKDWTGLTDADWTAYSIIFVSGTTSTRIYGYCTEAVTGKTALVDSISLKQITNAALANGTVY